MVNGEWGKGQSRIRSLELEIRILGLGYLGLGVCVLRWKNWTQLKGSIINCGGKRWAENIARSRLISS